MTVSWYDGATLEFSFAPLKGALDSTVNADFTADVSAYVRGGVRINRGRGFETDAFSTGSMTLTLDNRDRRFDPEYSSGPYYGNLLPMRPFRCRLTYSGSTSTLFYGFVREWRQGWDVGNSDAICTVTVDDLFKILANVALPESIWYADVTADSPTAWYRLGDESGATLCRDSSGNARHAFYTSLGATATATGLPVFSPDGARATEALAVINTVGDGIATQAHYVSGTTWSFECWFKSTTGTYNGDIWTQSDKDPYSGSALGLAPSTYFEISTASGDTVISWSDGTTSGTLTYLAANVAIADGSRHHLAFTRSGSTVTFYVDGVAKTPSSSSGSMSVGGTTFGTKSRIGIATTLTGLQATIDEVALYSSALSSVRVLAHYAAGSDAYSGDDTIKDRIARVVSAAGLTNLTLASEQDTTLVGGCDFNDGSTTMLAYLQMLERTESGRLFPTVDGSLAFYARYHDATQTVQAAFTDASGSTLPYVELGHEFDDSRVINDARVSRTNGGTQRVTDSTSMTAYGARAVTVDGLAFLSDEQSLDRANAVVYRYKDAKARFTSVAVAPRAAPSTLFPKVRTLDIGQRISVRRLPVGTGSAFTKELTIEGVQHAFDVNGNWITSYLTAPGDLSAVWLILDTGVLDTNRLGF